MNHFIPNFEVRQSVLTMYCLDLNHTCMNNSVLTTLTFKSVFLRMQKLKVRCRLIGNDPSDSREGSYDSY